MEKFIFSSIIDTFVRLIRTKLLYENIFDKNQQDRSFHNPSNDHSLKESLKWKIIFWINLLILRHK